MVLKSLATKVFPAVRSIHTSTVVRSGHDTRGVYGSNLPFPVHNKYLLFGLFVIFFGSGTALPFITLRSMVLAKNQG